MVEKTYKALVVRGNPEQGFQRAVEELPFDDLPEGEVLIRVHFSSLNYKDALSAIGNRGVTRSFPHTPGVDAAGVVDASSSDRFACGDEVICMGYDLGMSTSGGFSEYIRVPARWVLAKPVDLSLYQTMQIGTAGFTAAQCVDRLLHFGVLPDQGPVLVTGATGGVGTTAISLLHKMGFVVAGVTGKQEEHEFLRQLGCSTLLNRTRAVGRQSAALLRERWAGVVDTVGGEILASAIKASRYDGVVTCCGNAASGELPLTVYPFILRGVSLVGIDSAACPLKRRRAIWQKLSGPWRLDILDDISTTLTLEQVSTAIDSMLAGKIRGRIVVDLGGKV